MLIFIDALLMWDTLSFLNVSPGSADLSFKFDPLGNEVIPVNFPPYGKEAVK